MKIVKSLEIKEISPDHFHNLDYLPSFHQIEQLDQINYLSAIKIENKSFLQQNMSSRWKAWQRSERCLQCEFIPHQ